MTTGPASGNGLPSAPAPSFPDELAAASDAAAVAVGGYQDLYLQLAERTVRLSFAGPALIPIIGPAFAHLRIGARPEVDLSIRLWDGSSTGSPAPAIPWSSIEHRAYGPIPELTSEQLYTELQHGTDALSCLDVDRARGFYYAPSAARLAELEGAAPLRGLLSAWLIEVGLSPVHAAAIGGASGCVLVVGPKGAGKSSTALACLAGGLRILGDDYCAVGFLAEPTVFSLYATVKAHADTLARVPTTAARAGSRPAGSDEKALLLLGSEPEDGLLSQAPLRGVLVAHVSHVPETRLRPVSAAAALKGAIPGSVLQSARRSQAALSTLARVTRSVPCQRLEAGTDPSSLASTVASLL